VFIFQFRLLNTQEPVSIEKRPDYTWWLSKSEGMRINGCHGNCNYNTADNTFITNYPVSDPLKW